MILLCLFSDAPGQFIQGLLLLAGWAQYTPLLLLLVTLRSLDFLRLISQEAPFLAPALCWCYVLSATVKDPKHLH